MKEHVMKRISVLMLASMALMAPAVAVGQVAGSTLIGVAAGELREVATGWSAQRQVLRQPVFNDNDERIGTIDDIIIAPSKAVSYVVINAGGFIGVTKHNVAIPVSQLRQVGDKLVLPGATRDALKASPPFEYAIQ
jgi:sporulation protein YlmC with PRC-barrel domain